MAKSNISNLAQEIISSIYSKWQRFLPSLPLYNKVIVEEVNNKSKIITIEKDNIKIVIGNDIEITEGNKSIIVDKDLNIISKGSINIVANSSNIVNNTIERFVTEQRLKTYLSTITDSFGSPIFVIGDVMNADLGTNNIKTTLES